MRAPKTAREGGSACEGGRVKFGGLPGVRNHLITEVFQKRIEVPYARPTEGVVVPDTLEVKCTKGGEEEEGGGRISKSQMRQQT